MNKALITLLLILLVCGCNTPQHYRPPVCVPEHWKNEVDEEEDPYNIRWWEQFNDPVLNALILEALSNNNDLKVAVANVQAFFAQWLIVRSQLFPQINLDIFGQKTKASQAASLTPLDGFRTTNLYSFLGTVTWEIDLWAKLRSATQAAAEDLLSQEEARRGVILTVVSSTASAYFTLRLFDWQKLISEKTLESYKYSYDLALLRFQEGLTSELEVKQAESLVENAAAEVIRLTNQIALQENLLSVLLGRYPSEIDRGKRLEDIYNPPEIPIGLPVELLCRRPDIRQAEYELSAAHIRIWEARAAFLPNFSLNAFDGFQSLLIKNWFMEKANTWQYTLNVAQPIFTGGLLIGQLDLAIALKWRAYYQYFQTILAAFQDVENALSTHRNSLELVKVETKRVEVVKRYLVLARLQYDNGETDYLNVLDAERQLFLAQLDLAQAEGDALNALVDIYKALGGGWVWDAEYINNSYLFGKP